MNVLKMKNARVKINKALVELDEAIKKGKETQKLKSDDAKKLHDVRSLMVQATYDLEV